MARVSRNPNAATVEAKNLFIYGDETGHRVTCPKELASRTGCHERTIREYQKTWQSERVEMLKSVHDGSLVAGLSEETLNKAHHDEVFIRARMDELKIQFDEVSEIEDKLFTLLDSMDDKVAMGLKEYGKLESLLTKYLENNASKRAITTQFLTLQKRWQEISGLESRMKAGESALKAIATTQAKAEAEEALERKKREEMRDATPSEDSGELAVFRD